MRTLSIHHRHFEAPVERLRPWIEACWRGTERDPFPGDVILDWRRNPDGRKLGAP